MADYSRPSNILSLRGHSIELPSDKLPKDYAQLLRNVRCYIGTEIRQRPGLSLLGDLDAARSGAVLWGVRTNDPAVTPFHRMFGTADGRIYIDDAAHTTFSNIDSGYDALGYTNMIARPDRAPNPFYFVANATRQSKFTGAGVRTNWGLPAPLTAPTVALVQPAYRLIDDCNNAALYTGVNTGALTDPTRINAIAISNILYDTGTTGWACVNPATMDESFQPGVFITTSTNAETVPIDSIYPAIATTTIGSIVYDSGASGLCTIQLATPTAGLQRNSFIRLNASENVRVLSVTRSNDDIPSIRVSTTGTFSAGNSVAGLASFRIYFANNHAAAATLSTDYINIPVSAAGIATVTRTAAFDLSSTNTGATRPIQFDDFLHISILTSDWSLINEIQIAFDIDAATNDFTQNYYFSSLRPPDLLGAIQQTSSSLTAQQQEMQRQSVDDYRITTTAPTPMTPVYQPVSPQDKARIKNLISLAGPFKVTSQSIVAKSEYDKLVARGQRDPELEQLLNVSITAVPQLLGQPYVPPQGQGQGPVSAPAIPGASQWTEMFVPISSFQKVGSDNSRGWQNVAAIRLSIQATAAVTVGMDAIWVGGTYGPDGFTDGGGYFYRYLGRNTSTGSKSNPSPPTRSPEFPRRGAVTGTIPTYADSQADVFDVYRLGGTVADWHYVVTVPSSAPTFTDTLPDETVLRQELLSFDRFQPWPRPDRPKAGTGNVTGTTFTRVSGDNFDTNWAAGTQIIINDQVYSAYTQPAGTDFWELTESGGTLAAVRWEIPEPLLVGRPMPIVVGPYKAASAEFHFGCGDPTNPGYLYFTNGDDPESASDENILELCSPEEKLMAGIVLDGILYWWSDRRSWRILPSFQGGQTGAGNLFYDQETSMGKGLAAKYALTAGDRLYWVSYDGIYASRGDAIESLTDDSIKPLFRVDGSLYDSASVPSPFVRIDFTEAAEPYHHLTYSRDGLYHDYRGVDGNYYTNFFSFLTGGWVLDIYRDPITFTLREKGAYVDTIVRGSGVGRVYLEDASTFLDNSLGFDCRVLTREELMDDTRATHQIGDQMIDANPNGQTVAATLRFDQNTSSVALTNLTGSSRTKFVRDVNSGDGAVAIATALDLTWTSVNAITKLYEWQPSMIPKPEYILRRVTDWDNAGYEGPKWVQGMRLHADTLNVGKSLQIQGDAEAVIANITATHDGEVIKEYSWNPPVVAHLLRILGTDDDPWRLMNIEWIFEPEPPLAQTWYTQYTDLDLAGFHHIRDFLIPYRSTADISLTINSDGTAMGPYTIPSSAGARARYYLVPNAFKQKYVQLILTSTQDFSLYREDVEVRAKAWGSAEAYVTLRPFGDFSRATGDGGGARV